MPNLKQIRTIIYCVLCGTTGAPVYVGKTTMLLQRRIDNHLGSARRKAKTKFHRWLALNQSNFKVLILADVPFEESGAAEMRWIKRLDKRFSLLNMKEYSTGNPGVGRVNWNDEALALLGKRTDTAIAAILGCNRQTVAYRRELLGIPRLPDPHKAPNEILLDSDTLGKLGKEPDYKIAQVLGISKFVIAKHRNRMGIPSYAATTGNNGKIRTGEKHRRWK